MVQQAATTGYDGAISVYGYGFIADVVLHFSIHGKLHPLCGCESLTIFAAL